jgi:hypothetical protein
MRVEKLDRQGNQLDVKIGQSRYFFSYGRCIVWVNMFGKVHLSSDYWDFSKTTSKYRNQFLCESTQEIQSKINSGRYVLADLS